MAKKATGTDADGNIVTITYEGDLTISGINPEDEHTIKTVESDGLTRVVPFIGGRPDDR